VRRAEALRAGLDQQTQPRLEQAEEARAQDGPPWDGRTRPGGELGWELPWLAAWAREVSAADRRLREAHGAPGADSPAQGDLPLPWGGRYVSF
jgi:hypothetical protein